MQCIVKLYVQSLESVMKAGEEYTCPQTGRCPMSSQGPHWPVNRNQEQTHRAVCRDRFIFPMSSYLHQPPRHRGLRDILRPYSKCTLTHLVCHTPHHAHCSGNKDVRKWEYNSIHTFSRGFYATSVTLNKAGIISPGPKVSPPMYVKSVMISTEKIG